MAEEKILFPRGVDSAKVILVIETKSARGAGTPEQPTRLVTEYWSLEGIKLAEYDPIFGNYTITHIKHKGTRRNNYANEIRS